jgi:hypothetical protein
MANLTKEQRHNRMLETTFAYYKNHQESLPPCHLYGRFLEIAEEKLCITKNEARAKYGQYTVQQWESLLNLGWNKNN